MTTEPLDEQAIFEAARKMGSQEARDAYLQKACGDDVAAAQRIRALLQAYNESASFLEAPAAASIATIAEPGQEFRGAVIGPYKLIQQIGEGGMGTVWMAQQTEPVKRLVAVKLIKAGMDSKQVMARFDAERQALALMDHPNIAKVLDAGTIGSEPDAPARGNTRTLAHPSGAVGRPYFVMDLVKGVPITKYCDEHHLTPAQRLELFIPVCQAIQHAHQKGVIHRDLKPSNVLVALYDGKPVPKVIDFGVAKATGQSLTERTLVTGFGAVVGTLEYMSPEQAEINQLDIDTRSDIYSLGVLLYELLTGSPPFSRKELEKTGMLEMLRVIREEEPSKPSTKLGSSERLPTLAANRGMEPAKLTKALRGELDWIVMKALEKDRNRRYESANGFAADLQRYLCGEAVQAVPPSMSYRFKKFARRNKRALVMIGCVAFVLLVGSIISSWQAVRATKAEQKAVRNFDRATEAVRRMLTRVAQDELIDVPWMEPVRKTLLEDALQFYEQLLAERSADPEIRLATAGAHFELAWINGRYGNQAKRAEEIRLGLELMEPLAEEFPENVRYRAGLARGLHLQAHPSAFSQKRCKEGEQLLRRAVKLQESVVSATPDSADNAYDLANMLHLLGTALRMGGQFDEAEAVYARVVSIGAHGAAKDPNDPALLRAQVRGLTSTAEMILQKDPDRAEELLLRAQALAARFQEARRKTGFLFDTAADTVAQVDEVLGRVYRQTGRTQQAAASFRRAVAVYQKYADDFPAIRHYQARLGPACAELAGSLSGPGDREEAAPVWQRAIRIQEKLAADAEEPVHRLRLARTYRGFGKWLKEGERDDEAETAYRRALALAVALAGEAPNDIEYRDVAAWSAESLGAILQKAKRFEEAEQLFRQAVKFHQTRIAEHPADKRYSNHAARVQRLIANVLRASGRLDEAIKHCASLVAEFPEDLEGRVALSLAHHEVANAANQAKRPADAEAAFQSACQVMETAAGDFPKAARAWEVLGFRADALGWFLMNQKRPGEAEKAWAKGLHAFDTAAAMSPSSADLYRFWAAVTCRSLAEAALAQARPKEAEELWLKALDTFHALPGTPMQADKRHVRVTGCANRYAGWLRSQNRQQEAIALMQRGIDYYAGLHAKIPSERIFRDELADQSRKLAWWLANALNPKIRDSKRAVELAKQAVELAPEDGLGWNTFGVAHYRAGQWQDALTGLERSMELRKGGDSLDWFFLAMTHQQLGHNDTAANWYGKAVEWMEKNQPSNEELGRFRKEAAMLLKVK